MERYLNLALRERRSYGAVDVAQAFFHKPLNQLTLAEAAFLVRASTSSLSFFGNRPSMYQMHTAIKRRNWTLKRMAEAGFITAEEAEEASKEPLVLQEAAPQK